MGPQGIDVLKQAIAAIGQLGLLMQMFFIGTKLEIQTFAEKLKKPFTGVMAQLVFSLIFIAVLGQFYQ